MIRVLELKDYESAKKLVYQVHQLHLKNRPDIYIDGNPLPIEYFEKIINDKNSLNYVYEEDGEIVGILTALLLLQSGYTYIPYSSLESIIEKNKEAYYSKTI